MAKLGQTPQTTNQKLYIAQEGQEKFNKLPGKYSNDDARLAGKLTAPQSQEGPSEVTQMMKMMEAMQAKLDKLEAKDSNAFVDAKKINDDPKQFSYKIWKNKPVLSYKSKVRDDNYGYTYAHPITGRITSNQLLVLDLFDMETGEVVHDTIEVNHFNTHSTKSDKMVATVVGKNESFVFNVNSKEFTVLSSVIN